MHGGRFSGGCSRSARCWGWRCTSRTRRRTSRPTEAPEFAVTFTPDGREFYGLGWSKPFAFDARSGEARPISVTRLAQSLCRSPDGHWVAARSVMSELSENSEKSELRILVDDRFVCSPSEPGRLTHSLVLPNGKNVVAGGGGGLILWDVTSCAEVRRWKCELSEFGPWPSLTASADSTLLATSTPDHEIKVWNTRTGEEVVTLRGHRGAISALDISPDRSQLVSGSYDGSVRLWNIAPEAKR